MTIVKLCHTPNSIHCLICLHIKLAQFSWWVQKVKFNVFCKKVKRLISILDASWQWWYLLYKMTTKWFCWISLVQGTNCSITLLIPVTGLGDNRYWWMISQKAPNIDLPAQIINCTEQISEWDKTLYIYKYNPRNLTYCNLQMSQFNTTLYVPYPVTLMTMSMECQSFVFWVNLNSLMLSTQIQAATFWRNVVSSGTLCLSFLQSFL